MYTPSNSAVGGRTNLICMLVDGFGDRSTFQTILLLLRELKQEMEER